MTVKVHFQPVPQNPENSHIVTVDLSPSSSNRSWLTRRNIVIGGALGIGITAAAITAYLLSANNAFTEIALSTNTTDTSTEYFADPTESSVNQSTLSLYRITQLVETEPNHYGNCTSAFKKHLETFITCGKMLCECVYNARDTFELYCSSYAKNILKTPEECKEAGVRIQRCIEFMKVGKKRALDGSIYCYIEGSV